MDKPKVAFYWCASCGGCEEALVDLGEDLLAVAAAVDVVFWPCALDFKRTDLEALPDGALAAALVNGAVRTDEQLEMVHLLRRKAQVLIAFGSCAAHGGIPALANLTSRERILARAYHESPTVGGADAGEPRPHSQVGGHDLELPVFHETVSKLSDVTTVDYFLPGCPPTHDCVKAALTALLTGQLPARGAVLLPDRSLCQDCPRAASKPDEFTLPPLRRVIDVILDPDRCFLAQGVVCVGPVTRSGCGSPCMAGNMPCTGCFGPVAGVRDAGGKMIAALGALGPGQTPAEVDAGLSRLADPAGTFYRYTLSASLLGSQRRETD